jgi:hypothetical protein
MATEGFAHRNQRKCLATETTETTESFLDLGDRPGPQHAWAPRSTQSFITIQNTFGDFGVFGG